MLTDTEAIFIFILFPFYLIVLGCGKLRAASTIAFALVLTRTWMAALSDGGGLTILPIFSILSIAQ